MTNSLRSSMRLPKVLQPVQETLLLWRRGMAPKYHKVSSTYVSSANEFFPLAQYHASASWDTLIPASKRVLQ